MEESSELASLAAALDPVRWQPILDAHRDAFAEGDCAMRIAVLPRHVTAADGTRRSVVQRRSPPTAMLVWEHDGDGMRARGGVFEGLDALDADLLFVGNDGALESVLARAPAAALGEMKRRLTGGAIQLFVFRSRDVLRELGYEDFLELLGLPFLGACR